MSIHLSNLIQLYFNRNQKYLKHKKIILIMAIMATIIKVHHDSCREVNPLILKVFLTLFALLHHQFWLYIYHLLFACLRRYLTVEHY